MSIYNAQEDKDDEYITFITSIPIHPLGIKAGQIVILDYTWNDLNELMNDLLKKRCRIFDPNTNHEDVMIIEGIVPLIEDICSEMNESLDSWSRKNSDALE